jgi:hypothetical protein
MNMGDTAQKAAVAFLIDAIVTAVITQAAPNTQAEAIAEMYKLVNDDPTTTIGSVSLATDPFNNPVADPELHNIFEAAGATYPGE